MIRFGSGSAQQNDMGRVLKSGASVLALCVMAAAAPAFAQDAPAAGADQTTPETKDSTAIVVTGIRGSLANSQNIKKNSDTVVDAITAQDIGALPDRSVTEALQRVPGVAMNRFAGSSDPDHFSVEGSGVVVRGLNYVRSEFNGRDTFSTGVYGQAINFSDVPAELLGSVEVYKNATAEMIEGGLSGTVNLNTRLPLTNKGFHLNIDAEANYGDFAKKWSPTGSVMISNTWDTGIGTIGVLGSVSYSQIYSRADGLQIANFQTRNNSLAIASNSTTTTTCRNPLPTSTDATTLPPGGSACGVNPTAGADGLADLAGTRYAPLGGQYRTQNFNRERRGIALAAQWESLDRRAILTAQFLRSDSTQKWGEHTFEAAPDVADYNTFPYGCRPNSNGPATNTGNATIRAECPVGAGSIFKNYTYDSDGVFENGYITLPGSGWRAPDSGGTWRTPTGGVENSVTARNVSDENIVDDYGLNFKFTPNDHWQINLDGQYVQAKHDDLDMSIYGSTFADDQIDLTGTYPTITKHKPLWLSATWSGCTPAAGMPAGTCSPNAALNNATDAQYFTNKQFYFTRAAMDHIERSTGEEIAFKGDVAYNFGNDGFLKRVKFGARYADRDQTIRGGSTYNWGVVSETWAGSGQIWYDNPISASHVSFDGFNNFFRGQAKGPPGGFYYNGDLINGYDQAATYLKTIEAAGGASGAWQPMMVNGVITFPPGSIQSVSERNINAYTMLSFGTDNFFSGVGLSGNIGLRMADTRLKSVGAFTIPTQAQLGITLPFHTTGGVTGRCEPTVPAGAPPGTPPSVPGGICAIGEAAYAQLQQFANGQNVPNTAINTYRYFLPSLNLKFQITDKFLARFAASRALTRPGLADVRNFITIGTNGTSLTASTGNPYQKPALSDQFDVTLEWYFARVGSLTFDAFYKRIHNFFVADTINRSITNNGVTETIGIRGPGNYKGTGTVKGFEIAYQQTFDFLPGLLSGFGVNTSYTYIDSKGVPNTFLNGGSAVNQSPIGTAGNLPLEQLSKHNVNVAVFYEKGPISIRAAYNWRSRFLLTASDVIIPYYPIFNEATGQLDGSIFLNVTKFLKVGVQGVNLTNEVTKTSQQYTLDGRLGPRSYFMNDRRFSFIARASF